MQSQLLLSLVSGIFIGGIAAYLGALMIERKMSLVAGPLGHLALPGVALALIYGFDISLGAFPFILLGALLIWLLKMKTELPLETLTAIIFATGVGSALLFLPLDKAEEALTGNIMRIGIGEGLTAIVISFLLFLIVQRIIPKLILMNISEDLAQVEGVNIKKCYLLYLFIIGVIVALGVKLVGGLLTAALVAIPAAAARNMSRSMRSYLLLSLLIGMVAVSGGILVSFFTKLPAGPVIILVNTFIFTVSTILKKNS